VENVLNLNTGKVKPEDRTSTGKVKPKDRMRKRRWGEAKTGDTGSGVTYRQGKKEKHKKIQLRLKCVVVIHGSRKGGDRIWTRRGRERETSGTNRK
jgi:hypothetical protein